MSTAASPAAPAVFQQIILTAIETGADSQSRVHIRPAVVRAYTRAMIQQVSEGGLRFPAVVLFKDAEHHWLGDGFHRILAARAAGLSEFPADVRPGTQRDALLFSISSNDDHGLPRTNADKKKAVTLLLADEEWSQWSDNEVARRCHVSQSFVTRVRKSASYLGDKMRPRKVRRGDKVYEMRAKKRSSQTTPPEHVADTAASAAAPATDPVGIPLPLDTVPAFASLSVFEAAEKLHLELAELVDHLAKSPGGAAYRENLVRRFKDGKPAFYSPELQVFAQKLSSAAPRCGICPRCSPGRVRSACKLCGGRGWLSKGEFETCAEYERQELKRLAGSRTESSVALPI